MLGSLKETLHVSVQRVHKGADGWERLGMLEYKFKMLRLDSSFIVE
jgi:hypothetical protein